MKMFLTILILAAAAVGFAQQRKITALREGLEEKRAEANEAIALRKQSAERSQAEVTPQQVSQMRAERLELMRLRATMPDLRMAAQTPEKIEQEIARLTAASDAEKQKAQISKASYTEEMRSKALHSVLRALGSMLAVTSQQSGGNKPVRSFDELKAALAASGKIPNVEDVWKHLSEPQPPFNISKDTFEFVPAEATRTGCARKMLFDEGIWS
jgi:hypothetical protein